MDQETGVNIIDQETTPDQGSIKNKILFWGGLLFALVQLVIPVFVYLIDLQMRAIHVGMGISLAFLIYPFRKVMKKEKLYWWDILIILGVLVSNINIYLKTMQIYNNPGSANNIDLALGIFLFIVILEATRRAIGIIIPVMLLAMVAYIFMSPYFGGVWQMRGLSWDLLVNSIILFSPWDLWFRDRDVCNLHCNVCDLRGTALRHRRRQDLQLNLRLH
jgi:TRAP-type uncharacterized transport system fused permease subunit